MHTRMGCRNESGRLLSEFLVSLGLLFLALTANVAILHSAARSSVEAAAANRALELARDGIERMIADPRSSGVQRNFGSDGVSVVDTVFQRRGWVIPVKQAGAGLARVAVEVEWTEGGRSYKVRLERYARES